MSLLMSVDRFSNFDGDISNAVWLQTIGRREEERGCGVEVKVREVRSSSHRFASSRVDEAIQFM